MTDSNIKARRRRAERSGLSGSWTAAIYLELVIRPETRHHRQKDTALPKDETIETLHVPCCVDLLQASLPIRCSRFNRTRSISSFHASRPYAALPIPMRKCSDDCCTRHHHHHHHNLADDAAHLSRPAKIESSSRNASARSSDFTSCRMHSDSSCGWAQIYS